MEDLRHSEEDNILSIARHWSESPDICFGIVLDWAISNKISVKEFCTIMFEKFYSIIEFSKFVDNIFQVSPLLSTDPKEFLLAMNEVSKSGIMKSEDHKYTILKKILWCNQCYWKKSINFLYDMLDATDLSTYFQETAGNYSIKGTFQDPIVTIEEKTNAASDFNNGTALLVGVSDYKNIRSLSNVVINDVKDVHDILVSKNTCCYDPRQVKILDNTDASITGLKDGLEWLITNAKQNGTCIIYFTGHGGRIKENEKYINALLPYDFDPSNPLGTSLKSNDLSTYFKRIPSERLVVILDCCHSGGIGEFKSYFSFEYGVDIKSLNETTGGKGRIIIASSDKNEISRILPGMNNSVFTHYIKEALNGKAKTRGDGFIRILDLYDYVSEKVPLCTSESQHPILKVHESNQNFPVALCLRGQKKTTEIAHQSDIAEERTIRQQISNAFNEYELKVLIERLNIILKEKEIDIKVDRNAIKGEHHNEVVLELIQFCKRHQIYDYLLLAVKLERPNLF